MLPRESLVGVLASFQIGGIWNLLASAREASVYFPGQRRREAAWE